MKYISRPSVSSILIQQESGYHGEIITDRISHSVNFTTLFPSVDAIKSTDRPEAAEGRHGPRRRGALVAYVKLGDSRKICNQFYSGGTHGVATSRRATCTTYQRFYTVSSATGNPPRLA